MSARVVGLLASALLPACAPALVGCPGARAPGSTAIVLAADPTRVEACRLVRVRLEAVERLRVREDERAENTIKVERPRRR